MSEDVYKLVGVAAVLIAVFAIVAFFYLRDQGRDRAEQVAEQKRIAEQVPHVLRVKATPRQGDITGLEAFSWAGTGTAIEGDFLGGGGFHAFRVPGRSALRLHGHSRPGFQDRREARR